jgi:hypothetical protein
VWFLSGEAVGTSFNFAFGPIEQVTLGNGVPGVISPGSTNGPQVVPNDGTSSTWTLTLKNSKGTVIATSNPVTATDSC